MADLIQYGDDLVDPDTGEIVESVAAMTVEEKLPRIAAALRVAEARLDEIDEYEKREVERIRAHCSTQRERQGGQHFYLMSLAHELMDSTGKEKLDYPGRGKFAIRPPRKCYGNYVDDTVWFTAMSREKQRSIRNDVGQVVFPRVVVEKIDKAKLYKCLADGMEIPGFKLKTPDNVFTFKAEEG